MTYKRFSLNNLRQGDDESTISGRTDVTHAYNNIAHILSYIVKLLYI